MLRIVALNEEGDEESEEEVAVTKEAQETIAESEYMRAIKMKSQGKPESALLLLKELLDTEVLSEISEDNKNDKLWAIRYNCLKNIAMICEENEDYEHALNNYKMAMQIDDSDVYTMHRFGQLALKTNTLELADYAFQSCLKRNPMHWRAADGVLQTLCRNKNILGAYVLALKLYRTDPYYERASATLQEISKAFNDCIPFYEKFGGAFPCEVLNEISVSKDRVLPVADSIADEAEEKENERKSRKMPYPNSLNQYRIKQANWLTIGQYILTVYNHLKETQQSLFFTYKYEQIIATGDSNNICCDDKVLPQELNIDAATREESSNNSNSSSCDATAVITSKANANSIQDIKSETENLTSVLTNSQSSDVNGFVPPTTEQLQQQQQQAGPQKTTAPSNATINLDANNEDSDSNAKSDGNDASNKPKPRRRCSDLHFLEQWGWHKSRRYSSRKKPQQERPEVDTTLNGILRKIYAKFMSNSFEKTWPFSNDANAINGNDISNGDNYNNDSNEMADRSHACKACATTLTLEQFQLETETKFDSLDQQLKAKPFDLMLLIYKWLKSLSLAADKRLPALLQSLYLSIFDLYLRHFDLSTWQQLSSANYAASYRICLLYLELLYAKLVHENVEITKEWRNIFNHLMFKSAAHACDESRLRLINLEYLCCSKCNQLEKCVACLDLMHEMIASESGRFVLHLPNTGNDCITEDFICNMRVELQRKIALNKVPKLFEDSNWSELYNIISNNILQSKDMRDSDDDWIQNFKTQIEILLQSLWNMNAYEECLLWSEKFLHYTTCQYMKDAAKKSQYIQKSWAESINFIFSYIEALLLNEGFDLLGYLDELLERLVQNLIRLLSAQLDGAFDKNCNPVHELDVKRPWVILHQIILREENYSPVIVKTKNTDCSDEDEDLVPNSFLVLFTAHEFLGKRLWCTRDNGGLLHYILDMVTTNLRAPLYDSCRESVYEYIEQVTYCLYGYPQKKARSRHLEEHEATPIELTWTRAIQIFDLYRPESLPEFNSYKLESITADMEQLLLKIVALMPKERDPTPNTAHITAFINGEADTLPEESPCPKLPYKINSIFYLLADYYFKNRDFFKTIKYYTLDLVGNTQRLDSWAGIALSKASKIETKLNSLTALNLSSLLVECEDTIRCFERCISLVRNHTLLWIEYGSFAYTIHSYCSRYVKHTSEKLSLEQFSLAEERKEKMLTIAYNCFNLAATLQNNITENSAEDNGESHEEKWLCQYMLGKIAEKRKEHPKIYLNYYLTAANYLYESGATYPIKINHSNPTTLSVEALEVFYRTNSAIIKYIEHEKEIQREHGDLFNNVLKNLSQSPFAFNKAKIDGNSLNAFKRKMADKIEQQPVPSKMLKKSNDEHPTTNTVELTATAALTAATATTATINEDIALKTDKVNEQQLVPQDIKVIENGSTTSTKTVHNDVDMKDEKVAVSTSTKTVHNDVDMKDEKVAVSSASPTRRESQESAATGTTTTTTITSSTTSSTSSSDSSSSDSDSDSDDTSAENDLKKRRENNSPYTEAELESLYKIIIRNLEECITRFPEHYKSIYRLVYHYMNGPANLRDIKHCEQLLLDQYKTNLGNQINGLFYDRKNNNIFNGIWRIPSSEIDRPGSFSAHLVKCTSLFIQLLMKIGNHKLLIDVGLQLYRTPDPDKRYIRDDERIELYHQSIACCAQILRNIFKTNMEKCNDEENLNLLIDIYKIHKKCVKYMNHKELLFTQLLVDVYKFYIQDKLDYIPDNLNFLDLSIKLCVQEITYRKNLEKSSNNNWHSMQYLANVGASAGSAVGSGVAGAEESPFGFSSNAPSTSQSQVTPTRQIQIPGLTMRQRVRSSLGKTATTTASTTTFGNMPQTFDNPFIPTINPTANVGADLLKSTNLLSMMNFALPSQSLQDSIEFQKLVAEYYKKIIEEKAVTLSGNFNLPISNASLSLASSLPIETTITPAQPKHILSSSSMLSSASSSVQSSSAVRISNCDITITPSITKPLAAFDTQSSSSSNLIKQSTAPATANFTLTKVSQSSSASNSYNITDTAIPFRDIELKAIPLQIQQQQSLHTVPITTTTAATAVYTPSVFVKPLANLQSPKSSQQSSQNFSDLSSKSLTITSLPPMSSNNAALSPDTSNNVTMTTANKYQPKAPRVSKNKQSQQAAKQQPFNLSSNIAIPTSIANATSSFLNTFNMDTYNQQAQLLSTYADLFKNRALQQQFQMLTAQPKARAAPKRKAKAAATSTVSVETALPVIPTSAATAAAAFSCMPATTQSPFSFPTFDSSSITMTTLPAAVSSSNVNTLSISKSSFVSSPSASLPHTFTQQQTMAAFLQSQQQQQISPTKTLQQKLAERQKANQQQNESNKTISNSGGGDSSGTATERKPSIDVIILD